MEVVFLLLAYIHLILTYTYISYKIWSFERLIIFHDLLQCFIVRFSLFMQRFQQYLARYYALIRYGDKLEPKFAICGDISLRNDDDTGRLWGIQDIVENFRFAWGVPKIRTCQGLLLFNFNLPFSI